MTNALYVVATPLGNLADISERAIATLRQVDLIACEDTRHTRRLLDQFAIRTPTMAVHEHNEASSAPKIIARLQAGQAVALVSDAGTPAISDPGARLVAAVRAANLPVRAVPGANAAVTAMSVAGFEAARFLFCGFLPPRTAARSRAIAELKAIDAALVFYEAPHRIVATVADLAAGLEVEREILIARELTKLFEETARLPLAAAPAWLAADANRQRGEFVLVISGPTKKNEVPPEALRTLQLLQAELPLAQAVKLASGITGVARHVLYDQALAWQKEHER